MKASVLSIFTLLAGIAATEPVLDPQDDGRKLECDPEGDRVVNYETCAAYFNKNFPSGEDTSFVVSEKKCSMLFCQGDCQISLCNDGDTRVHAKPEEISAAAKLISEKCPMQENGSVKGQVLHEADWNLLIKNAPCF